MPVAKKQGKRRPSTLALHIPPNKEEVSLVATASCKQLIQNHEVPQLSSESGSDEECELEHVACTPALPQEPTLLAKTELPLSKQTNTQECTEIEEVIEGELEEKRVETHSKYRVYDVDVEQCRAQNRNFGMKVYSYKDESHGPAHRKAHTQADTQAHRHPDEDDDCNFYLDALAEEDEIHYNSQKKRESQSLLPTCLKGRSKHTYCLKKKSVCDNNKSSATELVSPARMSSGMKFSSSEDNLQIPFERADCIQNFSRACPSHLVACTMCLCFTVVLSILCMIFIKMFEDIRILKKEVDFLEARYMWIESREFVEAFFQNRTNSTQSMLQVNASLSLKP
jgi:hypothetical protein